MPREELLKKLTEMLAEIVEEDDLQLTEQTEAEDVPDWDSTNHVRFLVAIESEFGIRFETNEMGAPQNVGELLTLVQSKL